MATDIRITKALTFMSITMKEHKAKVNPITPLNALYLKKCYIIKKTHFV